MLWLVIINVLAFSLFGIDKRRAVRGAWRVREASLLLTAVLGGGFGALLGMRVFHHKTKHRKFTIGVPFILILELVLAAVLTLIRAGILPLPG